MASSNLEEYDFTILENIQKNIIVRAVLDNQHNYLSIDYVGSSNEQDVVDGLRFQDVCSTGKKHGS